MKDANVISTILSEQGLQFTLLPKRELIRVSSLWFQMVKKYILDNNKGNINSPFDFRFLEQNGKKVLKGFRAQEAYLKLKKNKVYIYSNSPMHSFIVSSDAMLVTEKLLDKILLLKEYYNYDIYIIDYDLCWSYIKVHDESLGNGPYFCKWAMSD